ncbi:MAG: hypothetical protein MJ171_03740 [Clostridia bacterium]|nr:hypothetical protein [Clostridia bacterium]
MKRIEFLYPEFCYLYAEEYNMEYLGRCSSEIEILRTGHLETPKFVTEDVDMIYLGCTTEATQEYVIELLKPYTDKLKEHIEKGTVVFLTGNAIEIIGKSIKDEDRIIEALGIYDFTSERFMKRKRVNTQFVGRMGDDVIMGHMAKYSHMTGDITNPMIEITNGYGMNMESKIEGIHDHNLFATYSLGPFLILNPVFTKKILALLGLSDELLFEKEIMEAYEYRKTELMEKLK